jgi:mono/diheme cytochrome c family protein
MRPLAGACIVVAVTSCARSTERDQRDFERMRRQQRVDAYSMAAAFANGQAMQAAPPGTVTRETADDSAIVALMASGPATAAALAAMTPARLALGERKFGVYCAVCHGEGAFGGSVVAANMGIPRPPSLRSAAMLSKPPAYIYLVVTHGLGRMPAYVPQLTTGERWAVVGYLEQMRHDPVLTAAQRDDSLRAEEIHRIDAAARERRKP